MASQTEIVNRALIKLGGDTVTDISDRSKSARVMSAIWDTVRRSELTKNFWNFALTRAALPALGSVPLSQFTIAYQLPSDYLKIYQVGDFYDVNSLTDYINADDSPYAIEGQKILTNLDAPLNIRYVSDVTNSGLFDPLFAEMLASKLAYEACYQITQSRQGQEIAMNDYRMARKEAVFSNAISRPPQSIPDDSFILGRL